MPHLEINEVILVHCNNVISSYHEDSRALFTFIPNKSFGQLFSPGNLALKMTQRATNCERNDF